MHPHLVILADFPHIPSSGYLSQRYWLLPLPAPLSRVSFQTPRQKATPPSLPLYLPKEEKSLSKNVWRVAASRLSVNCTQFLDVEVYLPGSLVSGSTGKIPQELVSFLPKCFYVLLLFYFLKQWTAPGCVFTQGLCTTYAKLGQWLTAG